ncbi:hypothetical protein H5410_038176 [Solanum commersonii]|uniref:Secreted protein n=1 Tax=Solanum commersonii TaxID=4109 RepID=A0A9J5YBL5_SOLCO|nr:hypothetical protein H5410_038176 [Solanum commersonii]
MKKQFIILVLELAVALFMSKTLALCKSTIHFVCCKENVRIFVEMQLVCKDILTDSVLELLIFARRMSTYIVIIRSYVCEVLD